MPAADPDENAVEALPPEPAPAPAPLPALAPTTGGERVELIDVLRGFAILGILLVNMQMFFSPIYLMASAATWWSGTADRIVELSIQFVAQGKFYAMFSFLFGMGLAIQMERAEARGARFGRFFAMRLVWLLLIGAVHATLIWFGDILALYALLGFVLMLFRRRTNKTLLIWTIILMLLPLVLIGMGVLAFSMLQFAPADVQAETMESIELAGQETMELVDRARIVYATGGYGEILELRLTQLGTVYSYIIISAPNVLALFLIGLNLGRRRLFHNVAEHLPAIRRWAVALLLVGLAANTLGVIATTAIDDPMVPSPVMWLAQVGMIFGGAGLCFFYVTGVTLLYQRAAWRRLLGHLAPVGRMALTNYLMHSIVFTTLANSYGFGLYGKIPPSIGLLMTLTTFGLQIPLSAWWLRRFRFGPMEWVWRSLTYNRRQPMRR